MMAEKDVVQDAKTAGAAQDLKPKSVVTNRDKALPRGNLIAGLERIAYGIDQSHPTSPYMPTARSLIVDVIEEYTRVADKSIAEDWLVRSVKHLFRMQPIGLPEGSVTAVLPQHPDLDRVRNGIAALLERYEAQKAVLMARDIARTARGSDDKGHQDG